MYIQSSQQWCYKSDKLIGRFFVDYLPLLDVIRVRLQPLQMMHDAGNVSAVSLPVFYDNGETGISVTGTLEEKMKVILLCDERGCVNVYIRKIKEDNCTQPFTDEFESLQKYLFRLHHLNQDMHRYVPEMLGTISDEMKRVPLAINAWEQI